MKYIFLLFIVLFFVSCEEEKLKTPFDPGYNPDLWGPSNLQIEQYSISMIKLSWTQEENNISGFKIDKKIGSGYWQIAYDTQTSYYNTWVDTSPSLSEINYYRLYAYAGTNTSSNIEGSISLSFQAPSNLQLEQTSATSIILQWYDNSDGEEGFIIDRKVEDGEWVIGYGEVQENITEWSDEYINSEDVDNYIYYRLYAFYDSVNTSFIENSIKILYMSEYIDVPGNYACIQDAIDNALDGDTILIYTGNHEKIDISQSNFFSIENKNIVIGSLFLTTNDDSYISQTIVKNGFSFTSGVDSLTVISGFKIEDCGFGIYCNSSNPTVSNMIITETSQGIKCYNNSNPNISNLEIYNNNNSTLIGGGIACYYSNPIITDVSIYDNRARHGGGIACYDSNPILTRVTIEENTAGYCGGGIYLSNSSPSFFNVIIADNDAYGWSSAKGGGAYCTGSGSNPIFTNVVFYNNSATTNGKAMFCVYGVQSVFMNSIVWSSSGNCIYFYQYDEPCSITLEYTDIIWGESGINTNNNGFINWLEGNINEDPLFFGNSDYNLQDGSPCIDAGNPDAEYIDTDGSINDMGAYGGPYGAW